MFYFITCCSMGSRCRTACIVSLRCSFNGINIRVADARMASIVITDNSIMNQFIKLSQYHWHSCLNHTPIHCYYYYY